MPADANLVESVMDCIRRQQEEQAKELEANPRYIIYWNGRNKPEFSLNIRGASKEQAIDASMRDWKRSMKQSFRYVNDYMREGEQARDRIKKLEELRNSL